MRRVFAVRPGTEIYAVLAALVRRVGLRLPVHVAIGNVTCGNAVVRASRAVVVVRYDAFNAGCGDF